MKRTLYFLLAAAACLSCTKTIHETVVQYVEPKEVDVVDSSDDGEQKPTYSIQSFGVLPENTPGVNKVKLQQAIDWASERGAALYIEPEKGGYAVASGIVLKKNVSLVGAHGPTGRGTVKDGAPTGSLFKISDDTHPFITVESASSIRGVQFWYPEQSFNDPSAVKTYPPTLQVSHEQAVHGVTLTCLTFYGATYPMDFEARSNHPCEQILFEHCYGYPLGGKFIGIDYCYDIPRILHCHVNPAVMREFKGDYPKSMLDYVVSLKTYAYQINHTDNAQVMDVFTFGTYGGFYLGADSYGQLTNFNFDCVCNGIFKDGGSDFNRIWEVAQGSIIANLSPDAVVANIHPFIVQGKGQISIANVDAFSGNNGAITNQGQSYDYILVRGSSKVLVTGVNCRMRNYQSSSPLTIQNTKAQVSFLNCSDKDGNIRNFTYGL